MRIARAALSVGLIASLPVLGQGTIADGAATFILGASPFDTTPVADFRGVSTTLTQDHLFEQGWWYRIAGDTAETFFPAPTTQGYSGRQGDLAWTNVNTRGFSARQEITVLNGDGPTTGDGPAGHVMVALTVTNLGPGPLSIDLFHMADVDVQPTAGNDSAIVAGAAQHIRITDPGGQYAEYRGIGASAYLVRPFGATDLGAVLGDTSVTNFDNTGLPFGPADFTGGFQWSGNIIPPGRSQTFRVGLSVNQGAAYPDLPRVAVVGGTGSDEVAAKLMATGSFHSVGVLSNSVGTPTLAELRAHEAVLVWAGNPLSDATTFGNNLADYVDQGGGVVTAQYANTTLFRIGGRFDTQNYWAIQPAAGITGNGPQGLGTVLVAAHPILAGVSTFDGGSLSARPGPTAVLHPQAVRVANWTGSGTPPLVATRVMSGGARRVDLGLYPPSSDASPNFWTSTTDGARLMANAVLWTMSRRPRVAVMAAPGAGSEGFSLGVQRVLMASGSFSAVDNYYTHLAVPSLAQMQQYEALMVFNNATPPDPAALGDRLADYVDGGGGVVVGLFTGGIAGRFNTADYWAMSPVSPQLNNTREGLGLLTLPRHPVLAGVARFDGGTVSARPSTSNVPAAATRVADWTGPGTIPLVAERILDPTGNRRRRLDLGTFPPLGDNAFGLELDKPRLMANALLLVNRDLIFGDGFQQ
jgi:hypothetical protein